MWLAIRQVCFCAFARSVGALVLLFLCAALPPLPLVEGFGAHEGTENARSSSDSDSAQPLTPNTHARATLNPGVIRPYQIRLERGQYVRVVFEQRGGAGVLRVESPGGDFLAELTSRRDESMPIELIAKETGTYRLTLRSAGSGTDALDYSLTVEKIRQAVVADESRVLAQRALAEGNELQSALDAASVRAALDKYQEAISLWHAAGASREEASAMIAAGEIYRLLGEQKRALEFFKRALMLGRRAKIGSDEATALNHICYVQLSLGDNASALRFCDEGLALSRLIGFRRGEAQALNNIGELQYAQSEMQKSLNFYRQALDIWHSLGDRSGQAQALLNIGYTHSDLNNAQEAFDAYSRAMSLWQAVANYRGQALTLTAVGNLHSKLGEKQEALDNYHRALQLLGPLDDKVGQAFTLNGIAYVYSEMGEPAEALEHYQRALQLLRSVGYRWAEASTLIRIGSLQHLLGDERQALDCYQQARPIVRDLRDRRMESVLLLYMGTVYESMGDRPQALSQYLRSLALKKVGGDRRGTAYVLNSIGHIHEASGRREEAVSFYEQARKLNRATNDRFGEATTLLNIARARRDGGDVAGSREGIETSLGLIESLRTEVMSQELRASYFASVHKHYEFYIDLLMRLHKERPAEGFDAAAFETSERARARSLLETLKESRADIHQGVDPALLERERMLRQSLNTKAERQMQLGAGRHSDEEAAALAGEIDKLTAEYDEVEGQIKANSPHYAALTLPQPLTLKEVQQQVLNDNTLLLEYTLGDERSYLWAVTKTEVSVHELPKRVEIEGAARRLYDLLTARQPVLGETFEQHQERADSADGQYWQEADSLSRMVLGPVAGQLGTKRLIIVADGALQYIPFQALPEPGSTGLRAVDPGENPSADAGGMLPLMLTHEVVNEPSASCLAILGAETNRRAPAPKAIAVLADPVFEKDDPRVQGMTRPEPGVTEQPPELHRALRDVGVIGEGGGIPRLLASRAEAEAIMGETPPGAGLEAMGFDASRATATSGVLSQYRIVHFATHGLLNNEHPELSGLVLSLVDKQGRPQDGFLRLHDIYNLKLPADLVVLSACNTGLGKDVKGEGLVGLTRGFMYAGAAGVVASLWKVDDEATAELMKNFYEAMLKRGLPPSAALREAQVAMWKQKRWRAPYYWAAFVIQGQYKEREGFSREQGALAGRLASVGGGVVALSLIMFYALRRRRTNIL